MKNLNLECISWWRASDQLTFNGWWKKKKNSIFFEDYNQIILLQKLRQISLLQSWNVSQLPTIIELTLEAYMYCIFAQTHMYLK